MGAVYFILVLVLFIGLCFWLGYRFGFTLAPLAEALDDIDFDFGGHH